MTYVLQALTILAWQVIRKTPLISFERRPVDQLTTIMEWVLVFTSLLSSKCSCESAQMHLCFPHTQNMNVYNEKLRTTNGWISEHGRLKKAFAHMR